MIFAFRFEFVKVIFGTFEFWFHVLTVTIWMVSLGFYLQDARAAIIPSVWLDFVDMLLIETYFQNSQNVVAVAALFACFLLSLSVGVSLGAVQDVHNAELARLKPHAFALKDVLLNTMAAMVMLLVRLSYRRLESLRLQQRVKGSWTQSIAYRCQVRLRVIVASAPFTTSSSSTSSSAVAPDTKRILSAETASDNPDVPDVEHIDGHALLHVHTKDYCADTRGAPVATLAATLAFWTPFFCRSQRQLAARLWTSVDFLFAYTQMASAHMALCDMLAYDGLVVASVLASYCWMHGVLTMDTVPPVAREHLGWRPWVLVPVLVLRMALQVLLCGAVLGWRHERFQNHVLLNGAIGSYTLQLFVVPFFLSRQFTSFIWNVRQLHRFHTRASDHELLILLGNVEYNYDYWEQARWLRAAAAAAAAMAGPGASASLRHQLAVRLATVIWSPTTAIVPIASGSRGRGPIDVQR